MPHYMMMATGFLAGSDAESVPALRGSCAILSDKRSLVTAAHCVPDGLTSVYAYVPGRGSNRVAAWARHPTADIAVAIFGDNEESAMQGFELDALELREGGDFHAFGYPVEVGNSPTPRFFKGHFMRWMGYPDENGYFAAELSIPAPAGLSGGPIVHAHRPEVLTGVVTANRDSYIVIDSVENVEQDGTRTRIENRRVISYGIAAIITDELAGWIDETRRSLTIAVGRD